MPTQNEAVVAALGRATAGLPIGEAFRAHATLLRQGAEVFDANSTWPFQSVVDERRRRLKLAEALDTLAASYEDEAGGHAVRGYASPAAPYARRFNIHAAETKIGECTGCRTYGTLTPASWEEGKAGRVSSVDNEYCARCLPERITWARETGWEVNEVVGV